MILFSALMVFGVFIFQQKGKYYRHVRRRLAYKKTNKQTSSECHGANYLTHPVVSLGAIRFFHWFEKHEQILTDTASSLGSVSSSLISRALEQFD